MKSFTFYPIIGFLTPKFPDSLLGLKPVLIVERGLSVNGAGVSSRIKLDLFFLFVTGFENLYFYSNVREFESVD